MASRLLLALTTIIATLVIGCSSGNVYSDTISHLSSAQELRIHNVYADQQILQPDNAVFDEIVRLLEESKLEKQIGPGVRVPYSIKYTMIFTLEEARQVRFDYNNKPELWLNTKDIQYLASVDNSLDDVLTRLFE